MPGAGRRVGGAATNDDGSVFFLSGFEEVILFFRLPKKPLLGRMLFEEVVDKLEGA